MGQASVPRDALPPTPPGPEGSNGNGLLRVQWVAGVWLFRFAEIRSLTGSAVERVLSACSLIKLDITLCVGHNNRFIFQLENS
jgi:hypothetical protein